MANPKFEEELTEGMIEFTQCNAAGNRFFDLSWDDELRLKHFFSLVVAQKDKESRIFQWRQLLARLAAF